MPPPNTLIPNMVPGGPAVRPFPDGPWFRQTSAGVLQIYANGVWTSQAQSAPNTTLPPTRPRNGPPSNVAPGLVGIGAAYTSFNNLYDAIVAVLGAMSEADRIGAEGAVIAQREARAQDWVNWLASNPLGQQMAAKLACTANAISAVQSEIDKIVAIPHASRSQAHYHHLASLQMALSNMQAVQAYVQGLRNDFIWYGGNLPNVDQVNSVTCTPVPLEMAPMPLPTQVVPPQAVVPNSPPVGNGPLFPVLADNLESTGDS